MTGKDMHQSGAAKRNGTEDDDDKEDVDESDQDDKARPTAGDPVRILSTTRTRRLPFNLDSGKCYTIGLDDHTDVPYRVKGIGWFREDDVELCDDKVAWGADGPAVKLVSRQNSDNRRLTMSNNRGSIVERFHGMEIEVVPWLLANGDKNRFYGVVFDGNTKSDYTLVWKERSKYSGFKVDEPVKLASRVKTDGSYIKRPRLSERFKLYGNRVEVFRGLESEVQPWLEENGDKSRLYGIYRVQTKKGQRRFKYRLVWDAGGKYWARPVKLC